MLYLILSFAVPYLVGSIPTGYWFSKLLFDIDITKHGSKNIGATNVARVLGSIKYFFLIFFLDFSKAALSMLFIKKFIAPNFNSLLIAAALVVMGNAYSVLMNFRGGKGVSTTLGVLVVLFPFVFFGFILMWLASLIIFRSVGVASVIASAGMLVCYLKLCLGFTSYVFDIYSLLLLVFLSAFIIFRHKNNIREVFTG